MRVVNENELTNQVLCRHARHFPTRSFVCETLWVAAALYVNFNLMRGWLMTAMMMMVVMVNWLPCLTHMLLNSVWWRNKRNECSPILFNRWEWEICSFICSPGDQEPSIYILISLRWWWCTTQEHIRGNNRRSRGEKEDMMKYRLRMF